MSFRALMVEKSEDSFSVGLKRMKLDDLPPGEVTIKVAYSSINYKDGLASIANGRVVSSYPMIPGIDLSGTVIASDNPSFKEGAEVLVTGYGLGVSHFGGYSEYARVPAEWVQPLPPGLTLREAMVIGTAGFTAALSIQRLEENGLRPDLGPVLVTGASGGVGSSAVTMLARLGYQVVASSGKVSEHSLLQKLGAQEVLTREDIIGLGERPLEKQRWAGAVDPVGGNSLGYILKTMHYGGSVAVSGLTGGTAIQTTVMPFILRGVNLLGIDSVYCPAEVRTKLWQRLGDDLKPELLIEHLVEEIDLEALPAKLSAILQSQIKGRTIVRLQEN